MQDTIFFDALDWLWKHFPDLATVAIFLYFTFWFGFKVSSLVNYFKGLGDQIKRLDDRIDNTDRELRVELKKFDERLNAVEERLTRVEKILVRIDTFLSTTNENYPRA